MIRFICVEERPKRSPITDTPRLGERRIHLTLSDLVHELDDVARELSSGQPSVAVAPLPEEIVHARREFAHPHEHREVELDVLRRQFLEELFLVSRVLVPRKTIGGSPHRSAEHGLDARDKA